MAGETTGGSTSNQSFEEKYGVSSNTNRNITTGNNVVTNAGLSPVVGYNFMLRVEGVMDLPCKAIRAFSKEMEYELIQEGGLNDYVHMRRKPISRPFYFEVDRYIGVDYVDPLPLGAELLLPVILMVARNPGNFEASARVYTFTGCTVTKKSYGEMDADKSGLFVETTTIAYRELVVVDSPISEMIPYAPDDPNPKRSLSQATVKSNIEAERAAENKENEAKLAKDAQEMQARKAQEAKDRKAREAELRASESDALEQTAQPSEAIREQTEAERQTAPSE